MSSLDSNSRSLSLQKLAQKYQVTHFSVKPQYCCSGVQNHSQDELKELAKIVNAPLLGRSLQSAYL